MGGTTLRGGQTVFHGIRMWAQLFQAAIMLAAFMAVAVPAWNLWRSTTGADWYAASMFTLAEAKLAFGYDPETGQDVHEPDGTRRVLTIREIAASVPAWRVRERIKAELFRSAWLGLKVGLGIIALFLAWFWLRGAQLGRQRRLRGAELVPAAELRRRVQPLNLRLLESLPGTSAARAYRVAGVPYPLRTETQHTIVSGTTGSGKTVLISDLVAQIRAKGERCVLYDKMGTYTRAFFDPDRDVLMNPLDARAPRWSPFLEARGPTDFDMIAAALIPQQRDTEELLRRGEPRARQGRARHRRCGRAPRPASGRHRRAHRRARRDRGRWSAIRRRRSRRRSGRWPNRTEHRRRFARRASRLRSSEAEANRTWDCSARAFRPARSQRVVCDSVCRRRCHMRNPSDGRGPRSRC